MNAPLLSLEQHSGKSGGWKPEFPGPCGVRPSGGPWLLWPLRAQSGQPWEPRPQAAVARSGAPGKAAQPAWIGLAGAEAMRGISPSDTL
jgi:hypothetical protein